MHVRILEQIKNPRAFDAFINENMKTSTYKVAWNAEMEVEYEASKNWSAATADYAAAMLGTVIDAHSDKPKQEMPSIGELSGALARIGDEWQIPNDRLEQYYYMENRYRDRVKNMSEERKLSEYKKIVKYLFNPYELASIAPHRRIWAQYLEGLSDGQVTVTKTNNKGGIVWARPIPTGIKKALLRPTDQVWNISNIQNIDVIATLQYLEGIADDAGKTVLEFRVSKATASLITQCPQFQQLIGFQLGKLKTDSSPGIGIVDINKYLETIELPPIKVVKEKGILSDGTAFNLFKDGRIVAMCANRVAVLKVSDPLESIDPHPLKTYATYNDNLVSHWRDTKGRYVSYEMFAFPAFVGNKDVFILDVTQKAA